jgi:uncharacterized protein (UPF0333 family)
MARKAKVQLTEAEAAAKKAERAAAKAANFTKLAAKRMTKALQAIELVQRLSNRNSYIYTDDQVNKMTDALDKAVSKLVTSYSATAKAAEKSGFTFE